MTTPPARKTVFVVGAGASAEVKLPVGSELKKLIAEVFRPPAVRPSGQPELKGAEGMEPIIVQALKSAERHLRDPSFRITDLLDAGRHISSAMPQAFSIDHFIDAHRDNKLFKFCGKLAIVRTILRAEANSLLSVEHANGAVHPNFDQLESTWFNRFTQHLFQDCHRSDLERSLSSVALIVFNYDRCIEHYLYHTLQNYYNMEATAASTLLRHLAIYHPYGTVGHLPWLDSTNSIDFGATPSPTQLVDLADQIKTFTEGTDKTSSEISAIQSAIVAAEKVVFLGFSFNSMNLDVLQPPRGPGPLPDRRVFATAYGLSDSHRASIPGALLTHNIVGRTTQVELRALKCAELFHEFGWALRL